jgi:hypothetical protein
MRRRALGKKKIPVYGWAYAKIVSSLNWVVPTETTQVDVCIVGPGKSGWYGNYSSMYFTQDGGNGGGGGLMSIYTNIPFTQGETIPITINGSYSQFKNSSYKVNILDVYTTGNGGYGSHIDANWISIQDATQGGDGNYLFNDSSIDGIKYGAGGGGGALLEGRYYASNKPGGTHGGGAGDFITEEYGGDGGSGKTGIICIRYKTIVGYQ